MRTPARIVILIGLLGGLAGWIALEHDENRDAGPTIEAKPGTASNAPRAVVPGVPEMLPRQDLPELRADPFSPRAPQAPPAPVVVRPPAPGPPPFTYRFAGRLRQSGGTQVFLAKGDQVVAVRQGDVLDGQYRIDAIDDDAVTLTYLPLRSKIRLDPASDAEAAVAASAPPATDASSAHLTWEGPKSAKYGASFKVSLRLTAEQSIVAVPIQLQFDPKVLESVAVEPGELFGDRHRVEFAHHVSPEGAIRVGISSSVPVFAKNSEVLALTFRAALGEGVARIEVASLTVQTEGAVALGYAPLRPFAIGLTR